MTGTTEQSSQKRDGFQTDRRWSTPELLTLVGLAVTTAFLGSIGLGSKEMWPDELDTWYVVSGSFGDMLSIIRAWDLNSAPYFVALWFWSTISDSATWLRVPSVLGAVAAVVFVAHLGRRLFDTKVGLIAAVVVAASGSMLPHSQEARTYTIATALAAASSLCFLRAERSRSTRAWTAYAVVSITLVAIHLLGALVVAAHAAWLLLTRPERIRHPERGLIGAGAAIALIAIPLAVAVYSQHATYDGAYVGEPWQIETYTRVLDFWAGGSRKALLAYAVPIIAVVAGVLRALRSDGIRRAAERELFVVVGVAAPLVALTILSAIGPNLILSRYLIVCIPCFAVLAARGLQLLPRLVAIPLLALILVGSLLQARSWLQGESLEPFAALTAHIVDGLQPGDQITFLRDYDRLGVLYNTRDLPVDDLPVLVNPTDLDPPAWRGEIEVADPVEATQRAGMWVVVRTPNGEILDEHGELLQEWFDAGFEPVSVAEFPHRTLYEFRPAG